MGCKGKANVEGEEPRLNDDCFCMGAGPQVSAALKMGSEKTRQHFRTARIEFLKGLRNLIDERIETLSQDRDAQKGAKIEVD